MPAFKMREVVGWERATPSLLYAVLSCGHRVRHPASRHQPLTKRCVECALVKRRASPEPETMNGFPLWPDRTCGGCGFKVNADAEEPYLYLLVCPGCYREGCDECMPAGRGCLCPDCEDGDG